MKHNNIRVTILIPAFVCFFIVRFIALTPLKKFGGFILFGNIFIIF